jgi:hypothetical protein
MHPYTSISDGLRSKKAHRLAPGGAHDIPLRDGKPGIPSKSNGSVAPLLRGNAFDGIVPVASFLCRMRSDQINSHHQLTAAFVRLDSLTTTVYQTGMDGNGPRAGKGDSPACPRTEYRPLNRKRREDRYSQPHTPADTTRRDLAPRTSRDHSSHASGSRPATAHYQGSEILGAVEGHPVSTCTQGNRAKDTD